MSYTKKQISNFLNEKVLFRFSISDSNLIDFNQLEELFTFDELENVIKSNLEYWRNVSEKAQNNYFSRWENLSNKIASTRKYFSSIEELDLSDINNYFYKGKMMIEYKNISKKYDGQEILKDVSFAVKKGDIYGIQSIFD